MGQKAKQPSAAFSFANRQNFMARWENVDFGVIAGHATSTAVWPNTESVEAYFTMQRLFLASLLERMDAFMEVGMAQGWKCIPMTKK